MFSLSSPTSFFRRCFFPWRLLSFSPAAAAVMVVTAVAGAHGAAATPRCTKSEQPDYYLVHIWST